MVPDVLCFGVEFFVQRPHGRAALDHFTAVSGVGSSPALATCEASQVLLAGVTGSFSRGSLVFAHLLIGSSHMR